jgi:hypothetical protein
VKKVTGLLLVYAILVIASCCFWVWSAVSKSRLTEGGNTDNVSLAADANRLKKNAKMVTDNATELTGGVMEGIKADGQVNDIVKSDDL